MRTLDPLTTEPFEGLTIAVLLGGQSPEREVSLSSGAGVLQALQRLGLRAVPVDPEPDLVCQLRAAGADVVFNILHGGPGENGAIQGVLDAAGIPYTGSGVLASALAMNKAQTKRLLEAAGIPTPPWVLFDGDCCADAALAEAERTVGLPAVIKPVDLGSSVDVAIVRTPEDLRSAVDELLAKYGRCFAERYISGKEITVGIVGYGQRLRALPVLEIVPKKEFYDYEAKYTKGMTDLICPARLSPEETLQAQQTALAAHKLIGCHGISRVDMHVDADGQVWVHEVNSIPGMTETSDVPAEARVAGMSYDELVLEILHSALPRMAAAQPGKPLPPI
ncbi:MAG: D-alanine--D-alanine ligase [Armatimonadetes bacterium]|nr:D-alanine--D-alanine ligase [Armatimonadota bacterium]